METLKKIGILTWYNHGNYGSALQAYALKTFLEKLGYKAQIIPYIPQWERSLLNANFLKKCKRFVKMLLGYCFECTPFKKNRFCDPFIYFRLNFLKLGCVITELYDDITYSQLRNRLEIGWQTDKIKEFCSQKLRYSNKTYSCMRKMYIDMKEPIRWWQVRIVNKLCKITKR